ncbi:MULTISPECIES: hypothetical protein [unclassified Sphingomonas]|uniref:hypothetical protein n=1 Tax=unclassified Sphingomonas TaxID=196159 RepID=UPI00226AD49B|nr:MULTISPECIES: hypothetical protein [unclassified Sphingomonas]
MNGNSKHTLYGLLFIALCLVTAGILYWVIRPSATTTQPVLEQTKVSDMNVGNDAVVASRGDDAPIDAGRSNADRETISTPSEPSTPQLGSCSSDGCSWSKQVSRSVVQADRRGQLNKLNLVGGSSTDEKGRITWNSRPHEVYVFCSTALPAVMISDAGKWQVDVLDFIDGVPGILESSQSLYAQTCHPGEQAFPRDAEALGYTSIPDEDEDVIVSHPADIFDRANTRS